MPWSKAILNAAKEEVFEAFERPWLLITAIVVPLLLMCLLISSFSAGLMRNLPVGFVDYDHSAESVRLAVQLESVPSVSLKDYDSTPQALDAMAANQIFALVVVPQNWSAKVAAQRNDSALEFYLSKTLYAIASTLELDIKKTLASLSLEKMAGKIAAAGIGSKGAKYTLTTLKLDVNTSGNTTFNYREYLLATFLPGVFSICIALTMVGVYVREWNEKRLSLWIETKENLALRLIGKMLPWTALYCVCAVAYVSYFAGYLGNTPTGSLGFWILGAVLLATSMITLPLMIVSFSPMWIIALSVTIGTTAPIFPYTGFSYPLESMTAGPLFLSNLFPLTWFLKLQSSQWVLGSTLPHTLYLIGILSLFTIIPLLIGLIVMPYRIRAWAKKEKISKEPPYTYQARTFLARAFEGVRYGLTRSETMIIFAVAIAFYLFFYAWPYVNQSIMSVPTAVVDLDRSAASRSLIQKIDSMTAIQLKSVTNDTGTAHNLYRDEVVDAVLVIPKYYETDISSNKQAKLGLTLNGAFPVKARAVEASLLGLVQEEATIAITKNLLRMGAPKESIKKITIAPVSLVTVHRHNVLSGYAGYTVPAVAAVILQAVLLIGIVMTLGQWLDRNEPKESLRRVLTSKAEYLTLFFGYSVFAFLWIAYAEGVDFWLYEFTSLVNPIGSFLVMLLMSMAIVAFGFCMALMLNSHIYGAQLCVVVSAPFFFCSGILFPAQQFGLFSAVTRLFIPSTPGILGLVAASQNGASTIAIGPELLHLFALLVFYLIIGMLLAKYRAKERGW